VAICCRGRYPDRGRIPFTPPHPNPKKKEARRMKTCGSYVTRGLVFLLASGLGFPGHGQGQTASYLDFDGLTRELQSIVNSSDLATMESLGTTLEGREVWLVTVGNPRGVSLDQRPAVLVVGNLEGDHVVGSQLSLEAIRYLVDNTNEPAVREVLDTQVFYFFPRLNPDGAEAMFSRVKWNRRTNAKPRDGDNDGRLDEDGPEDLNGDGYITMMRVADPTGPYMVDPADPRIMKTADATKGETGTHKVYWEGTDQDGDGFINEDGPGGVDLNRNFQHEYPYWQADAGKYMVSEVETRAVMDFALAHRNIAAILTFGETDNLVTPPDSRGGLAGAKVLDLATFADASLDGVFDVGVFGAGGGGGFRGFGGFFGGRGGGGGWLRGAQPGSDNDPSSGTRPVTTVATGDLVYFNTISDAYKEITGIERVPVHRSPEGAFFQFGYFQFGVPSFSTPGWGLPEAEAPTRDEGRPPQADSPEEASGRVPRGGMPAGGRMLGARGGAAGQAAGARGGGGSGSDGEILKGLEAAGIEAFADWSTYQHPDLGEVEIGGFLPYVTHNPPAEQLPELGAKHGEFLVKLAGMLPKVRIADTEVTAHGGGLFTVEVTVENAGFLPTSIQHGVRSRAVGPTLVQIQIDPGDILTGADKTASVGVLAGSGARESVTWVIRGRQGAEVEIKLLSAKAGRDTVTITLR
jgi:hypothetical protein